MRTALAFVTIALIACSTGAYAQSPSNRPTRRDTTRVVFVCEHGSVKSMIAATLFNRLAAERGLAARAVSRGTRPDSVIPQLVRDGLHADGADIGDVRPRGFGAAEARTASLLVTFDVELPSPVAGVPLRRWDGTPSVMKAYPLGRAAIASRVRTLVSELERQSAGRPARRTRLR